MELEDLQDLRAKVRKFLILTNERKKMSKTTLRKRISLTVVTALTAGVLTSVATSPVANAHSGIVGTAAPASNVAVIDGTVNASLMVAQLNTTSGSAIIGGLVRGADVAARSIGLLAKDTTSGVAQTASMLVSGSLSLYANATTDVGFVATGGTFNISATDTTYSQDRKSAFVDLAASGTQVAIIWTAPSTAGTYTISTYSQTTSAGENTVSLTTPSGGTLSGKITVSVLAASTGGSYSPVYSVCNTSTITTQPQLSSTTSGAAAGAANADSGDTVINGGVWYINMRLSDALSNPLDDGNIVVTATNGAFVNYAEGTTAAAGTASTVVAYKNARDAANPFLGGSVTVTQPTANAPITTTVTVTYNGTTVCTKTVTIRGEVAKIVVSDIITQDLGVGSGVANGSWIDDSSGRPGLFTVAATDSAGNQVATSGTGTFAASAASLAGQTIVSSLTVDYSATETSSTAAQRYSTGIYTCGAVAGDVKTAKLTFTNSGTGNVVTSDAFTLRCADNPYTYTASWDKASYVQGEIATLTVKFLDSKGFAANNIAGATGSWTGVTPMLTPISATGAAPVLDKNGTKTYTYSVGGSTAITAGSYVSVIEFPTLTNGTKQTPSYKVSTGGDTTSNADILKSIVALIASINKQIQALQKLILKR
jgi:hypothetical protein